MKKKVFREKYNETIKAIEKAVETLKQKPNKEMKIAGVEVKVQKPKTTKKKAGK